MVLDEFKSLSRHPHGLVIRKIDSLRTLSPEPAAKLSPLQNVETHEGRDAAQNPKRSVLRSAGKSNRALASHFQLLPPPYIDPFILHFKGS
jgi:hypothetical protein